jgi:membrane peptidoglycan carboxypeptidase
MLLNAFISAEDKDFYRHGGIAFEASSAPCATT